MRMLFGRKSIVATRACSAMMIIIIFMHYATAGTMHDFILTQRLHNQKLLADIKPEIKALQLKTQLNTPTAMITRPQHEMKPPLVTLPLDTVSHIKLPSTPVVIFVSFSMSMQSLKAWTEQAKLLHTPIVIQGLVNGNFRRYSKTSAHVIWT